MKITIQGKELYHYGIKGQKRGVRRFQNEDGSYTALGRTSQDGHGRYSNIKDDEKSESSKKGLTDKQKKYIKIGLAVAGTALLTVGAIYAYKNKDAIKKYINIGASKIGLLKNKVYDVKDISIVDPEGLLGRGSLTGKISEAVKDVNPSREANHCQQNVVASCLKFMGAGDITTKEGTWSIKPGTIVDKVFKGFSESKIKQPNVLFNTADDASSWIIKRLKPVNGSCGSISMNLKNQGENGHAIMWFMQDDKIKFTDPFARTDNNGGFKVIEDASFYFGNLFSNTGATISRLDDKEINYDGLKEFFNIA